MRILRLGLTQRFIRKEVVDSVPTHTDTLTGFFNGQSTAIVSGAPVLSTTATSASAPWDYPITLSVATLSAQNYSFTPVAGMLTALP